MGGTALPALLRALQDQYPWPGVGERAAKRLLWEVPALSDYLQQVPPVIFGAQSGFFYLPAAQAEAWEVSSFASEELLRLLGVGHAHFAFQDLAIDEGGIEPEATLLSDVCLLTYLTDLDELGARTSPAGAPLPSLRQLHDEHYRWYVEALLIELRHRRRVHPYSAAEIASLGHKAAPGNPILHLVARAAGRPQVADLLVDAVMHLCTGLQLLDDLNDFDADLRMGVLSPPISMVLAAVLRIRDPGEVPQLDNEQVLAAAAASGVLMACVEIARDAFTRSADLADRAGAEVLVGVADAWGVRAAERGDMIERALTG